MQFRPSEPSATAVELELERPVDARPAAIAVESGRPAVSAVPFSPSESGSRARGILEDDSLQDDILQDDPVPVIAATRASR